MSGVLVRGRNLPHWDVPGAAYFVTTCLEGSFPARGLLDIARYRDLLEARTRPPGVSAEIWTTRHRKMSFARTDEWLDHRPAVRHLADPKLAKVVVDALHFFAGQRYDLLAFVVGTVDNRLPKSVSGCYIAGPRRVLRCVVSS